MRLLVEAGADVNAQDVSGRPPLSTAISDANAEIVRLLVELGADVNAQDRSGHPPLYTAILGGNAEIVRLLIELGADVNARSRSGDSLIKAAGGRIEDGEPESEIILQILLDAGGIVDIPPRTPDIRIIDRSDSSLTVQVSRSGSLETYYEVQRRDAAGSGGWMS